MNYEEIAIGLTYDSPLYIAILCIRTLQVYLTLPDKVITTPKETPITENIENQNKRTALKRLDIDNWFTLTRFTAPIWAEDSAVVRTGYFVVRYA